MKKIFLIAAIAIAGTATAQVSKELNRFNRLKINSNAQIEIHKSTTSKIQFTGNEIELNQAVVSNNDGTLELVSLNDINSRYRIYTANIQALQIDGNAQVTFVGFGKLERLSVKTSNEALLDLDNTLVKNLLIDKENSSTVRVADTNSGTYRVDGKETDSI